MSYDVIQTDHGDIHRAPDLEHVTVTCKNGPDECAIFPGDTPEGGLPGWWITAQGESFVDLESMR